MTRPPARPPAEHIHFGPLVGHDEVADRAASDRHPVAAPVTARREAGMRDSLVGRGRRLGAAEGADS